jgi:hypothetical protein
MINRWEIGIRVGQDTYSFEIPPDGPHIALTIEFDDTSSEASFTYDDNIEDDVAARSFGPYKYSRLVSEDQTVQLVFAAQEAPAYANGLLDLWSLNERTDRDAGDFNGNRALDVADLDLLSAAIRAGSADLRFDVNKDRFVTTTDRQVWVTELKGTYFGDSNLDGEFNTADLVSVFQAGEYEDDFIENSTWATGDWDGNGEFNSRDLILAFTENGYEQGPRPASSPVPEPTGLVLASAWFLWTTKRGRRQNCAGRKVSV